MTTEDKRVARSVFSSPSVAGSAGGCAAPVAPVHGGRAGRWRTLPPAVAPLHGEKMAPLGAAHEQERLLDSRVHGITGYWSQGNWNQLFFLCFHLRVSK